MSNFPILLLVIGLSSVEALTTKMFPVADTYIDSGSPNAINGLSVDGYLFRDVDGNNAFFDVMVTFNISQIPVNFTDAFVTYQQQYVSIEEIHGPYMVFDVYSISPYWQENTAAWSNRPSVYSRILQNYQDDDITNVVFPVTNNVEYASGSGRDLVSYRLHSDYPQLCVFMRESAIQFRPTLTVIY